jgi:hypothetical protein
MKTIEEMAREAGDDWDATLSTDKEFLKRFAALVAAAEQKKWEDQTAVEIHEAILDEREQGQKWFDAVLEQHKIDVLAERSAGVKAEKEACAKLVGEFAQKWWSIHCASNKHMETTRKAHDDFCALQAAIRARGQA